MENKGTLSTAISSDGSVRLLMVRTTGIVQYAADRHHPSKTVTAALGRCLSAVALMGGTLKDPGGSLTLCLRGNGPAGSFTCVSDSEGHVRGCCEEPTAELPPNAAGKLDVGGVVGREGDLYVVRDYGFGEPYVGLTQLVSGEVAEDATSYYAVSEQVPTVCALGVQVGREGRVEGAGGYLLQLMPGADESLIPILQERVEVMPAISGLMARNVDAEQLADMLFGEIPHEVLETREISYQCNCAREKYRKSIKSIGIQELKEMADSGEEAEVICRFCGERHVFEPLELQAMYAERLAELREAKKRRDEKQKENGES